MFWSKRRHWDPKAQCWPSTSPSMWMVRDHHSSASPSRRESLAWALAHTSQGLWCRWRVTMLQPMFQRDFNMVHDLHRRRFSLKVKVKVPFGKLSDFSHFSLYFGLGFSMDGTHFLAGAKIGSAKLLFPFIICNPTGTENDELFEKFEEIFELGACYLIFNALFGFYNVRKEKKMVERWRKTELPGILRKHD